MKKLVKSELDKAIFSTNAFLKMFPTTREDYVRPRVWMKDGYNVSIQATEYAYCKPRINNNIYGYSKVELGYPSEADGLINDYAECPEEDDYIGTVYPYTPVEIVDALIEKHGGIVALSKYIETDEEEERKDVNN